MKANLGLTLNIFVCLFIFLTTTNALVWKSNLRHHIFDDAATFPGNTLRLYLFLHQDIMNRCSSRTKIVLNSIVHQDASASFHDTSFV